MGSISVVLLLLRRLLGSKDLLKHSLVRHFSDWKYYKIALSTCICDKCTGKLHTVASSKACDAAD